jgi:glycosyltransferase involved in cell wall biosynthesis
MPETSPSLRILHTPPRFYPYIGGVENICLDLCRDQVRDGHRVRVICAAHSSDPAPLDYQGIEIGRLRSWLKIAGTNITPALPFCLFGEKYDVMHTYLPTPWSADWSAIIAKAQGRPVVLTFCNEIVGKGRFSVIARLYSLTFLRLLLALSDRIVLISNEGDRFEKLTRLVPHPDKIVVIPPGTDVDFFLPEPDLQEKSTVFFLALLDEFHRYKGLDLLIRAMHTVCQKNPDAKLIVGGAGSLRSSYELLAAEMGISDRVEFCGFIPNFNLVAAFNRASVFVLPSTDSRQEGYGMVLAEAMACGVPVVTTTAVGMASAIRDNNAGLVVPPGNVQELAQSIGLLLCNQELSKQMGMNGRDLVKESFSNAKVNEGYQQVYLSCLKR